MSSNYFSPNKSITGGAAFFTFNSKEGSVYIRLLKQVANNASKKDNFDGKNPLNFKLSQDEVADIIRAIRTNSAASFYHSFNNEVTTGSFSHYIVPAKGDFKERQGFGLSIKKGDKEVKVGFTLGSAERLSLYLQFALDHIFSADYAADKKKAEEYAKNKQPKASQPEEQGEVQESEQDPGW